MAGRADGGTNVELTTVWGINGYVQHLWSPKWRTSLYGGYVEVDYNGTATTIINSHLPGAAGTTPCGVPVGGSCPASDHRCGGDQQLLAGLQLVAVRFADAVEPASGPRHRR